MLLKQGYILTSEIDGTIQMKSYLTGNPEIRLALNEDLNIGKDGRSIYGNSSYTSLVLYFLQSQVFSVIQVVLPS